MTPIPRSSSPRCPANLCGTKQSKWGFFFHNRGHDCAESHREGEKQSEKVVVSNGDMNMWETTILLNCQKINNQQKGNVNYNNNFLGCFWLFHSCFTLVYVLPNVNYLSLICVAAFALYLLRHRFCCWAPAPAVVPARVCCSAARTPVHAPLMQQVRQAHEIGKRKWKWASVSPFRVRHLSLSVNSLWSWHRIKFPNIVLATKQRWALTLDSGVLASLALTVRLLSLSGWL